MGLAVRPYAPAWKTTTRSPIRGSGSSTLVAEQVERSAQAAYDRCCGVRRLIKPVAKRKWIVAADDLAEVAGGRKLVMHAAVDDEVELPARFLTVNDPGDVDARFAD